MEKTRKYIIEKKRKIIKCQSCKKGKIKGEKCPKCGNHKCGDCAKFQKYHKTITKTGSTLYLACMYEKDPPKYLPESQKAKWIKEYLKKRELDDICDKFIKN